MIIAITSVIAIADDSHSSWVPDRKDLPAPEPVSPFQHLDEREGGHLRKPPRSRKFEYRVGKLSDADYQTTKKDLQKELSRVLAEVDKLKNGAAAVVALPPRRPPRA